MLKKNNPEISEGLKVFLKNYVKTCDNQVSAADLFGSDEEDE